MGNGKSWSLTARLLMKHFDGIGNKIAEQLAAFNPETATEVDREQLRKQLQGAAVKLAQARREYQKEQGDVDRLEKLISQDISGLSIIQEKLANGEVDEETVTLLLDEIEENKKRLPIEQEEAAMAKAFLDEVEEIVKILTAQAEAFDAHAKKVKSELSRAKAQEELQKARLAQQESIGQLKQGLGSASTALSAMQKQADKIRDRAEGAKILADIGQKPVDRANKVDELRHAISSGGQKESALDRLKRLQETAA